ncbi:hypothetical protein ACWGID_26890 [Kribbella sp. NPDC054772]
MIQEQHQEDTRIERLDPAATYEDDGDPPSSRHRADGDASPAAEVDPAYRGYKGGAAFFGWLVAIGLTTLLTGIAGAIAAAIDYARPIAWNNANADTIGIVSGAVLLVILAIGYYNGGYVAGRLARFDGGRQGFGVWMIGVVVTVVVAGVAALAGSQYDVLGRVDLPSIPIATDTLTSGGVVALIAAVVITLLAALIGGKAGQRYHRRIDVSAG